MLQHNPHFAVWKRLADEIGVNFDEKINERLKGIDRMTSLDILLEDSLRCYSQREKEKLAEKKNLFYLDSVAGITPDYLYCGVTNLLTRVRHRGMKIALGSASRNALYRNRQQGYINNGGHRIC